MRKRFGEAHWSAFVCRANRHYKGSYCKAFCRHVLCCAGPLGSRPCPHAFEDDLAAPDAPDTSCHACTLITSTRCTSRVLGDRSSWRPQRMHGMMVLMAVRCAAHSLVWRGLCKVRLVCTFGAGHGVRCRPWRRTYVLCTAIVLSESAVLLVGAMSWLWAWCARCAVCEFEGAAVGWVRLEDCV